MDRRPPTSVAQAAQVADRRWPTRPWPASRMMVLAFSGSAVPTVIDRAQQPAEVAQAAPTAVASSSRRSLLCLSTWCPPPPTAAPPRLPPAGRGCRRRPAPPRPSTRRRSRSIEGGSRSTLFGSDDSSANRPGGGRQTLIHRPEDRRKAACWPHRRWAALLDIGASRRVSHGRADSRVAEMTVSVPRVRPGSLLVGANGVALDRPRSSAA